MKNKFFSCVNPYLLLQISFILLISAGIKNSEAFYKWVDENGVVHFTDKPVNRKQAETSKQQGNASQQVKNKDEFDASVLDQGWLKKNIVSDEYVDLSGKKGFLKLAGSEKSVVEENLKMPIIYRKISCKNCDIKLHIDFSESINDSEKKYGGLVFFQEQIEDSWFFMGTRSDKLKIGNVESGEYKEVSAKKAKKLFERIVILVKKRETLFSFYFSEDDSKWEEIGQKEVNVDALNIGIFSETNSKGKNNILFDKFSIDTSPTVPK